MNLRGEREDGEAMPCVLSLPSSTLEGGTTMDETIMCRWPGCMSEAVAPVRENWVCRGHTDPAWTWLETHGSLADAPAGTEWATIIRGGRWKEHKPITEFKDSYRFLSNFWPAEVVYEGQKYRTVEHAYQAAKFPGRDDRYNIARESSPGYAKKTARFLSSIGGRMRPDWNDVRIEIMRTLVWQKFTTYPGLRRLLLDTEDRPMIEGNRWGDTFWGVDLRDTNFPGENWLGRVLMDVRRALVGGRYR